LFKKFGRVLCGPAADLIWGLDWHPNKGTINALIIAPRRDTRQIMRPSEASGPNNAYRRDGRQGMEPILAHIAIGPG
jgi:hypothetical protein